MQFFSTSYLSNGGRERNKIWHKGSLWDEDDAQTSNTHIAQRKRAIPHVTRDDEKYNVRNIRERRIDRTCVVVTAPCKLTLRTSVTTSHVTCVQVIAALDL